MASPVAPVNYQHREIGPESTAPHSTSIHIPEPMIITLSAVAAAAVCLPSDKSPIVW